MIGALPVFFVMHESNGIRSINDNIGSDSSMFSNGWSDADQKRLNSIYILHRNTRNYSQDSLLDCATASIQRSLSDGNNLVDGLSDRHEFVFHLTEFGNQGVTVIQKSHDVHLEDIYTTQGMHNNSSC